MVANYKNIALEKVFLLNDDAETCINLIDKKVVPILQFDDGSAMGESIDIAQKLDEMGDTAQVITEATYHASVTHHFSETNEAIWCLLFPRNVAIGLPEFKTETAIAFFTKNKEAMIKRSFEQAMSETDKHKVIVEEMLKQLPKLKLPSENTHRLSWDDIFIYPDLRNLTMIKDLKFPDNVKQYIDEIKEITKTDTYFDRAI